MAKAAPAVSKQAKISAPEKSATLARTSFTSSIGVVGLLLALTFVGVATQAIVLTGTVRLLMIAATCLCLLIGFWRPRLWLTIPAILLVAGGATAGALALKTSETTTLWIAISGAIIAVLGLVACGLRGRTRRAYHPIPTQPQIDTAPRVFATNEGRERLRAEITAAVQLRRPFSLLTGKACDWEREIQRWGISGAQDAYAEMLKAAMTQLRTQDIITREADYFFIVIIPDTTAAGGERTAQAIQEAARTLLDVRFSVVQCPDDGETEDELLGEAYQALAFAEMAHLPLVSRRALVMDPTS